MGTLMPFSSRRIPYTALGRRKMHRNLESPGTDSGPHGADVVFLRGDIARRHERIVRVLDRASHLLNDADQETDRLRIRVLQHAAGCLIAFAQEIAGTVDEPAVQRSTPA